MTRRLIPGLMAGALWLASTPSPAQIREVALDTRIDAADLIVEGTVVKSTPFAVAGEARIYTAYSVRVARLLKHDGSDPARFFQVEFVTPGGQVDGELHVVTPSLHPNVGDTGLFFLQAHLGYAGRATAWVPTASVQGFVRYLADAARDSFRVYDDTTRELFEPISRRTGESAVVLELQPSDPGPAFQGGLNITGFSPDTIRAGIREILTIDGSGFGTYTGTATVLFDNADDGPLGPSGPIDDEHVVSWTDNQIQIYVPNRNGGVPAGTGRFIVRGSSGAFQQSPSDLTIEYALKEIRTGGELFRLSLIDQDQRGGYSFRYSTATANNGVDITSVTGAVERFEESLSTWNCAVGWSADTDGTTTVQDTGNDGVNIVGFDHDGDRLPLGILGRTTSYFNRCGGDTWFVSGLDIRFRRDGTGVNWYYGADTAGLLGSEVDFASVAFHEGGHTMQLGHVNDATDAMYFAIPPGTYQRTPSAAAIAGAGDILNYSASFASCGRNGTLEFDCAAAPTAGFISDPLGVCGTTLLVDFVDTSLNGPTSWGWSFGDGGMSSERNPQHDYTSSGLYTVSLAATNANGTDIVTKNNSVVVTDAPVAPSCNPSFGGHDDCCSIGIFNVTLNTIDHTTLTPSQGNPLEEDFTCSQLTVLESGGSYPISITTGPANDEDVRVYIDWDNNGVLSGSELAFSSNDSIFHVGNIIVPAGAVKNTALRMRVLSDWYPQGVFSACENIEFGQVENYSVIVVDPAVATGPGRIPETSLRVDKSVTPGNLLLTWDASCGPDAMDFSIYQGNLGDWDSHTQKVCSTSGNLFRNLAPGNPSRYYLLVPFSLLAEGSYGVNSMSIERDVGVSTCTVIQDLADCP